MGFLCFFFGLTAVDTSFLIFSFFNKKKSIREANGDKVKIRLNRNGVKRVKSCPVLVKYLGKKSIGTLLKWGKI